MSDLFFPLNYDGVGGITLVDDNKAIVISQLRHLVKTITGERTLFPTLGINNEILFTAPQVPELLSEDIRLSILQQQGLTSDVKVSSYVEGKLKIDIFFSIENTPFNIDTVVNV